MDGEETTSEDERTDGEQMEKDLVNVAELLFTPTRVLSRSPIRELGNTGRGERTNKKRKQQQSPIDVSPKGKSTADYLDRVKREIQVIINSISREVGQKIQFNKGEKIAVEESVIKIQQVVSDMAYRMGVLEGKLSERAEQGSLTTEGEETREEKITRLEREVEKSREIERSIANTLNKQWELMKEVREDLRSIKGARERTSGYHEVDRNRKRRRSETGTQGYTDNELGTPRETERENEGSGDSGDSEMDEGDKFEEVSGGKRGKKKEKQTYANILGSKNERSRKEGTRTERESKRQNEPWKTPPPIIRNKIEVRMDGDQGAREKINRIKTAIRMGEKVGPVKNIFELPNKSMMILCNDENQKVKVCEKLRNHKDLKLREQKIITPTFRLTGIEAGCSPEEIADEIARWNQDILGEDLELAKNSMRVVTKRTCRDPRRENWIIEAKPEIFRRIMKKGCLEVDACLHGVEEYVSLALCFKCCLYGHVSKYCKVEKSVCYKCAGEHDGKDCKSDKIECANCKRVGREPRDHVARSQECPIMRRKIELERRLVDYEDGEKTDAEREETERVDE